MKNPVCRNSGRKVVVGLVWPNRVDWSIPKEQTTITCNACKKVLKRTTLRGEVVTWEMTRLFEYVRIHKATQKKEISNVDTNK